MNDGFFTLNNGRCFTELAEAVKTFELAAADGGNPSAKQPETGSPKAEVRSPSFEIDFPKSDDQFPPSAAGFPPSAV